MKKLKKTVTVPFESSFDNDPKEIRLIIDDAHEVAIECGKIGAGDWEIIQVDPSNYLNWIKNELFADGTNFMARGDRLNHVSQFLRENPMDSGLAVTLLYIQGESPQFIDGRHRAYFMATRGAKFIPLLIPKAQREKILALFSKSS